MQTDGAAVSLLDAVFRLAFQWAGWIVAAAVAVAAALSARYAHRSARAAEASAEVGDEALRHARESENRRARAVVAGLAQRVEDEHSRAVELHERLLREHRAAAELFGKTEVLGRKKAELMTVPDELRQRVERAEQQDVGADALRTLSPDELEELTNGLRSDLAYLRRRADGFDDERRELTSRVERHRLIDAVRQSRPPGNVGSR